MDIVQRLKNHAMPDANDEREVLHAPLLKEAANLIEAYRKKRSVDGLNGRVWDAQEHYKAEELVKKLDSCDWDGLYRFC